MLWRVRAVRGIDWRKAGAVAVPLALFSGFFALYLFTQTVMYTYDSVAYATQIRRFVEEGRAGWLFHPHHLLFNGMGFLVWRGLRLVGLDADPLRSLQYMNAFSGALGLALFYALLRRGGFQVDRSQGAGRGVGVIMAAAGALVLGLSYGYWQCATDGRVNMPGLAAVVLVLGFALGMLRKPGVGQCLTAAGATLLAVTLHQSHGLLIVPVAAAIMLSGVRWRRGAALSALYTGTTLALIGLVYIGIGVLVKGIHTYSGFNAWVLAYAHDGRWWNFSIKHNLLADVAGLAHVFTAQQINIYTLKHFTMYTTTFVLAAAALALCCGLSSRSLGYAFRCHKWRHVLVIALAVLPYAAFFTIWVPGFFVFWIPVAVMLIVGLVLVVGDMDARWKWVLPAGLMAAALGLVWCNMPVVARNMQRSSNPDLVLCDSLRTHARPGDLVIVTGTYQPSVMRSIYSETYLPYFLHVSVKTVGGECKLFGGDTEHAIRSIRGVTRLRMQAGRKVFVLSEFSADVTWRELERKWSLSEDARERILTGYRLQAVRSGGDVVAYRLVPARG